MPGHRKSAVRFRERAELLDFLLEVAAATSETLELDRLLANVGKIVAQVIPHELFALLLYSEKLGALRIRYAVGHREEVVRNLVIPLGEGITGAAARERKPILVPDVRTDPRYLNSVDAVRTELAVPMEARGKLVGVIDIESTRVDAYSEYDRALLRLIASRVAVAIDNARLYRRVERQNRTLRALAHLSQEFASILDPDVLLKRIAESVRQIIDYHGFSVLLLDEERKFLRNRFSLRYDERVDLDNIPYGKGITGAAVETREAVRVDNTLADPRYIPSHPDIRSEVAIPLVVKDRVIGVMDLESERLGYFSEDHVRTLSLLAPQIASSIENARLYEEVAQRERRLDQDLEAARRLQEVLLPKQAPDIPGLEIAIGFRAAREISGDLFDFFDRPGDQALVAFGDSSGHGAAAALYGALVSGLLRSLGRRGSRSPSQLMQALNAALLERRVDAQYVALLVLVWDARARTFNMANAGAVPPIILRRGSMVRPRVEGVPLGLLDAREYEEVLFQAEAGDLIVLYSDGVQDQLNAEEAEYGRGPLAELITGIGARAPGEILDAIFEDLDAFRGALPVADDQTLIVMKVL
jgi:sigma-B regulation protein RsbU (phosphoserine phosphatase)